MLDGTKYGFIWCWRMCDIWIPSSDRHVLGGTYVRHRVGGISGQMLMSKTMCSSHLPGYPRQTLKVCVLLVRRWVTEWTSSKCPLVDSF